MKGSAPHLKREGGIPRKTVVKPSFPLFGGAVLESAFYLLAAQLRGVREAPGVGYWIRRLGRARAIPTRKLNWLCLSGAYPCSSVLRHSSEHRLPDFIPITTLSDKKPLSSSSSPVHRQEATRPELVGGHTTTTDRGLNRGGPRTPALNRDSVGRGCHLCVTG